LIDTATKRLAALLDGAPVLLPDGTLDAPDRQFMVGDYYLAGGGGGGSGGSNDDFLMLLGAGIC
jgi:hypothetical protein